MIPTTCDKLKQVITTTGDQKITDEKIDTSTKEELKTSVTPAQEKRTTLFPYNNNRSTFTGKSLEIFWICATTCVFHDCLKTVPAVKGSM